VFAYFAAVNLATVDEDGAIVRLPARRAQHDDADFVGRDIQPGAAVGAFVVATDETHVTRFRSAWVATLLDRFGRYARSARLTSALRG
jgi:hypothetical protein